MERTIFKQSIEANSIEDLEANLADFLSHESEVMEDLDGSLYLVFQRHLLEHLGNLKIELYADEHAPPHFHIKANGINASFSIDSCEPIAGELPSKYEKKVRMWFPHAKPKLIDLWNRTRPIDCPVGKIET